MSGDDLNGGESDKHSHESPYVILFLFSSCTLGALMRTLLKQWAHYFPKLNLPYTVVLLLFGCLFGLVSRNFESVQNYTRMSTMDPHLLLHIFLPVLIFESAFAMEAHMFVKSIVQIFVLAVPGLIVASVLTALLAMYVFNYGWSFKIALLFGSIVSATDPVAVVSLLKELGAAKQLSVTIEGESLMNDGAAIVVFKLLMAIIIPVGDKIPAGGEVFGMCVKIVFGGPAFGYVMGKLTTFWLKNIFNDAITEITITLASTYMTFYIGEAVLGVSGVLAIVTLGVMLSINRAVISPEVEGSMHKFWDMMAYLANTLIFVLVGVVITEQALNSDVDEHKIDKNDWFYMVALYFAVNIIRGLTIGIFSPILQRVGYGLTWQNGVVMTWGGLRGAVGLALALLVYRTQGMDKKIGGKIVILTASLVVLTLVINGTTIAKLLEVLGMTDISPAKRMAMANVVQTLKETKTRSINMLKLDRFLADSDWKIVDEGTMIRDPYNTSEDQMNMEENFQIRPRSKCPDCKREFPTEPTPKEYREMEQEAILRKLKAQKVSYWRQFENGMLSQDAVRVLVGYVEAALDKPGELVHLSEVKKTWVISGFVPRLKQKLETIFYGKGTRQPLPPKSRCRAGFFRLVHSNTFVGFIYCIIFLNMIPVILEYLVEEVHYATNSTGIYKNIVVPNERIEAGTWNESDVTTYAKFGENEYLYTEYFLTRRFVNFGFFAIYALELIFKVIALKVIGYIRDNWNKLDAGLLVVAAIDIIIEEITQESTRTSKIGRSSFVLLKIARFLRLLRVGRIFRLFKPLIPRLIAVLNQRINKQLSFGYDVGKGFVVAEEELSKNIDHMVDNERIAGQMKKISLEQRMEVIKALGLLQQFHPGIAISVKSRQAIRSVLNNLLDATKEQKQGGLLDDTEYALLELELEEKIKRLSKLPPTIPPPDPIVILQNLPWLQNDQALIEFIKSRAQLKNFDHGNVLMRQGEKPQGIYIIVSGMLRQSARIPPASEGVELQAIDSLHIATQRGVLENTEYEDYLTAGNVIGETGVLTLRPRTATVTCETAVQTFFVTLNDMLTALNTFKTPVPSLEYKLWRICAIRASVSVLMGIDEYQGYSQDKIKLMLQRAFLPDIDEISIFTINDEIMKDVIVVQGVVIDVSTREGYVGPCAIPKNVTKLQILHRKYMGLKPKLLVMPSADYDPESEMFGGVLQLCLQHAALHRRESQSEITQKKKSTFRLASRVTKDSKTTVYPDSRLTVPLSSTSAIVSIQESSM